MAWLKFAAKTLQDVSKTLTRRPKKLSDLPQDAPPDALRCLQDAPKTPQDDPKTTPRRPKTPPRQPKSHKSTQNQNLIDFSSDPGRYPIGRSDGVPPPALNFPSPTCLLKLTLQKNMPPKLRFPKKPTKKKGAGGDRRRRLAIRWPLPV